MVQMSIHPNASVLWVGLLFFYLFKIPSRKRFDFPKGIIIYAAGRTGRTAFLALLLVDLPRLYGWGFTPFTAIFFGRRSSSGHGSRGIGSSKQSVSYGQARHFISTANWCRDGPSVPSSLVGNDGASDGDRGHAASFSDKTFKHSNFCAGSWRVWRPLLSHGRYSCESLKESLVWN